MAVWNLSFHMNSKLHLLRKIMMMMARSVTLSMEIVLGRIYLG